MTDKFQIKAVDMVRTIRDNQAQMLAGKSKAELIEFFAKAGETIRKDVDRRQTTEARQQ